MKLGLLVSPTLLLGCVSTGGNFIGQSMTSAILRADVLRDIRRAERYHYKCNKISAIHSEVRNVNKTGNPQQPLIVDELWRVTACGKTRYYPINMRADSRGETDYSILYGEKTQSGKQLK